MISDGGDLYVFALVNGRTKSLAWALHMGEWGPESRDRLIDLLTSDLINRSLVKYIISHIVFWRWAYYICLMHS